MSRTMLLGALALAGNLVAPAVASEQSDWSGGPGHSNPVEEWTEGFASAAGVSWRSIPGQLALSALPRDAPVETILAGDAGRPRSVAVGDLNGDGRDDALTVDPVTDPFARTGAIVWWEQRLDGSFRRRPLAEDFYGATYADTVDLDGDGDLDVIAAAYYGSPDRNGRYAWFENRSGDASSWEMHEVAGFYWGANWIDAADLDADGDLDLVGASYLTDGIVEKEGDIVWMENLDGAGSRWAEHDVDGDLPGALQAHAIDLDGDADVDIVAANLAPFEPNFFYWYENLVGDAGSWLRRQIPIPFTGAGYLDVGDLDGDGDGDLIGGGLFSGQVGFFENRDGRGADWLAWFVTAVDHGRHAKIADVDGDGDQDALIADGNGSGSGDVTWVENRDGTGRQWNRHPVRGGLDLPWIAAADLNADGKLDAVVSDEDLPPGVLELAWYDLTEFVSSGDLTSTVLDAGDQPEWGILAWDPSVSGGDLAVQVRAGADPDALGEWMAVPEPGIRLVALIDPTARYLQYRLILTRDAAGRSPGIRQIDADALLLEPIDPGTAGMENVLRARWDHPGDVLHFVASPRTGSTAIAGCDGLAVGLRRPWVLGSAETGADSLASLTVMVPPRAAGIGGYFQAIAKDSCKRSNRLEVLFP